MKNLFDEVKKSVQWVIDNRTSYEVAKALNVNARTINRYQNGTSEIGKMSFETAEKIYSYYLKEMDKMNNMKLTAENVEVVFDRVVEIISEELQNTSSYLMRAASKDDMAIELDMSVEEIAECLSVADAKKFESHEGAIIWVDYNKESFKLLLENTDEAIENFVYKVRLP